MMKSSAIILFSSFLFYCTVLTSAVSDTDSSSSSERSILGNENLQAKRGRYLKRANSSLWKPNDEHELLNVWDATQPERSTGHAKRLLTEWHRRFPNDNRFNKKDLQDKATTLILEGQPKNRMSITGMEVIQQQRLKILMDGKKFPFTPQLRDDLLESRKEAGPGTTGYAEKMFRSWVAKHPALADLGIDTVNLYAEKVKNMRKFKGELKISPPSGINLPHEQQTELINIWNHTTNRRSLLSPEEKIYKLWESKHPGIKVDSSALKKYADYLIWKDTKERLAKGESSNELSRRKRILKRDYSSTRAWTLEDKSQLIDEYEGRERGNRSRQTFHEKWTTKHIKFASLDYDTLYRYYTKFREDPDVLQYRAKKAKLTIVHPTQSISHQRESTPRLSTLAHQLVKKSDDTEREKSSNKKPNRELLNRLATWKPSTNSNAPLLMYPSGSLLSQPHTQQYVQGTVSEHKYGVHPGQQEYGESSVQRNYDGSSIYREYGGSSIYQEHGGSSSQIPYYESSAINHLLPYQPQQYSDLLGIGEFHGLEPHLEPSQNTHLSSLQALGRDNQHNYDEILAQTPYLGLSATDHLSPYPLQHHVNQGESQHNYGGYSSQVEYRGSSSQIPYYGIPTADHLFPHQQQHYDGHYGHYGASSSYMPQSNQDAPH